MRGLRTVSSAFKRLAITAALLVGLPMFVAGLVGTRSSSAWAEGAIRADGTFTMKAEARGLVPGGRVPLTVTIKNPQPFALEVHAIEVDPDAPNAGCAASNISVEPLRSPKLIPKLSDSTVSLSVSMSANPPNACQGARFPLRLSGTAGRPAERSFEVIPRETRLDGYINIEESAGGSKLVSNIRGTIDPGDRLRLRGTITDRDGRTVVLPEPVVLTTSRTTVDVPADVRSLSDGPIQISAAGTSDIGFLYSAGAGRILDLHAPAVSVDEPPFPGVLIGSTAKAGLGGARITGSAQDSVEVANVVVYLEPVLAPLNSVKLGPFSAKLKGAPTAKTWEISVDPGPGKWRVTALAYDAAGNPSATSNAVQMIIV